MRLVNDDRDLILKALTAAMFDARKAELDATELKLAHRVRDSQMTPAQIKATDSLPRNYFKAVARYDGLTAKWADEDGSNNTIQVHPGYDLNVPSYMNNPILLIEDRGLWDEMVAWRDAGKLFTEERDTFQKQTQGVLNAFTTVEKLLEHWPTIKDVMPTSFFEVRAPKPSTLPTTTINALDEQLRAKRPFPAELAAAA